MGAHRGRCILTGTVRRDGGTSAAHIDIAYLSGRIDDASSPHRSTAALQELLEIPAPSAGPTAETRASADGRFTFEALGPGLYLVTATAEDGARALTTVTLKVDGAIARAELMLVSNTETLTGRAMFKDGRPFTGAVYVVPTPCAQDLRILPPATKVSIDSDGRFVAAGLGRGQVAVSLIEAGVVRVTSGLISIPHAGELVLTVGETATLRTGRVVAADDGRPISRAIVLGGTQRYDRAFELYQTVTDEDGRFEMWLANERGGVRALAPGFAPGRTPLEDLSLGGGPIEIRLAREARLSGSVTAAVDGRPIAGVTVRLLSAEGPDSFFPPEPATTDSDGRYSFSSLASGEFMAFAEGGGWVTKGVTDVKRGGFNPFVVAMNAGESATFDMQVVKAATVTGVVVSADGDPVLGATVRAEGRQRARNYDSGGLLENQADGAAATNADGSFTIQGLVGGALYVFTASTRAEGYAHSPLLRVRDDPPLKIELRLAPVRKFELLVLDAGTGSPVAGARVVAYSEAQDELWEAESAPEPAGADGKVHLELRLPGPVKLRVDAEGYLSADGVPVVEGDAAPVIRLARGLELIGRVLLPDGSPAAGAKVEARMDEGSFRGTHITGCTADASGAFKLVFGSAYSFGIRAELRSRGLELEAVGVGTAGGDAVVLRLAPRAAAKAAPGTLLVRVLDPDGRPVPSARAMLEGTSGADDTVRNGQATFRPEADTDSWIEVWDAAGKDGSPLPLGPARVGPIAATSDEVVVRLGPEHRVEGLVQGPDGRGVRGAIVFSSVGLESTRSSYPGVRTDANGAFRFGRLGSGEVELTAQVPPEFVPPDPVRTKSDATDVVIRLRAAVNAKVTVIDAQEKPVSGAEVSARRSDGGASPPSVETDQDGVARLGGLDPSATYELEVISWSRPDVLQRSLDEWKPADLTVRLTRELAVRGIIRDTSGRPVAGARVSASSGRGLSFIDAELDGTFSFDCLPPGEVVLRASFPGHFGEEGPGVRVMASLEDVVLILDPGVEFVVHIDNWPAGERGKGGATLFEQGATTPTYAASQVDPTGTARFRGLGENHAFTLWVPPVSGGLSLLVGDLHAQARDVHVSLSRGKSISGRLRMPEGAKPRSVLASRVSGHMTVQGIVRPDGSYEILGLPEGRWDIQATAAKGNSRYSGAADATAGGTVDVELKAE